MFECQKYVLWGPHNVSTINTRRAEYTYVYIWSREIADPAAAGQILLIVCSSCTLSVRVVCCSCVLPVCQHHHPVLFQTWYCHSRDEPKQCHVAAMKFNCSRIHTRNMNHHASFSLTTNHGLFIFLPCGSRSLRTDPLLSVSTREKQLCSFAVLRYMPTKTDEDNIYHKNRRFHVCFDVRTKEGISRDRRNRIKRKNM